MSTKGESNTTLNNQTGLLSQGQGQGSSGGGFRVKKKVKKKEEEEEDKRKKKNKSKSGTNHFAPVLKYMKIRVSFTLHKLFV